MTYYEIIKIARPLLINLGYESSMDKPDLPDDTLIDVPLLVKKGHERMTVKQCAWGKHNRPTYYKVV